MHRARAARDSPRRAADRFLPEQSCRTERFADRAAIARDDRHAERHGFDQRHTETFVLGQHQQRIADEPAGFESRVVDVVEEVHVVGDAECGAAFAQVSRIAREPAIVLADDEQARVLGIVAAIARECVEQRCVSLVRRDAAKHQHVAASVAVAVEQARVGRLIEQRFAAMERCEHRTACGRQARGDEFGEVVGRAGECEIEAECREWSGSRVRLRNCA